VIVVFEGVAYEVVDSGAQGDPLELPAEQPRQDSEPPHLVEPVAEPEQPRTVPCLAALFGLALLPLRRRKEGA